ncbi:hypothetical protein [Acinetobacter sp. ANC 4470]|nr:hypothetical protein [Acinetobacter sp. ANC 4470]
MEAMKDQRIKRIQWDYSLLFKMMVVHEAEKKITVTLSNFDALNLT